MNRIQKIGRGLLLNWRGYLLAIGLVALATWLKYLAQPAIIPADVPILYMLAIVPTAIFFGLGPSSLVCILSLLAYDYFFTPPLHEFSLLHLQNAPILVIFLLVGILFSYLTSNMRQKNQIAEKEIVARKQNEVELAKYRDQLEVLVQQRTSELTKANLDLKEQISERKRVEEKLSQTLQRLDSHIDNSPLAVIEFDPQFRVIRWSREAEHMFGWTSQEIMGQSISQMKWVYEDDVELVSRVSDDLSGGKKPTGLNVNRNYRKDGSIIWCEWYTSSIYDSKGKLTSVLSQVLGITERKRVEEALKESEERFRALANNISQLAWMADEKGWRFWYNQRWYDYTGTTLEEVKGWGWQKVHHSEYVQKVIEKIKHCFETREAWEDTFPLRAKDGTYRWFLSRASPIFDAQSQIVRWFGTNTDVTEQLKAEESLRHYADELENANKELESFSYSVSHDLRAPLRGIDGFSNALLEDYEDKLDEQGKDYLNRIRKSSQVMSQLIDDMLHLSRISRAEMNPVKVNLSEIVQSIIRELKQFQPDRKAEFIISPEAIVIGDKALLDALLRNLLENAWRFTSKCPKSRIEFDTTHEDGIPVYYVRDNGIGFDMQHSDKLFKPFNRLHTQDEYPGTGIGLANVQRIVRRHGGRIWAEGAVGKGATFYFTLGK